MVVCVETQKTQKIQKIPKIPNLKTPKIQKIQKIQKNAHTTLLRTNFDHKLKILGIIICMLICCTDGCLMAFF